MLNDSGHLIIKSRVANFKLISSKIRFMCGFLMFLSLEIKVPPLLSAEYYTVEFESHRISLIDLMLQ